MTGHIQIPSSPTDRKKVNGKLSEMAKSLTMIEAERSHIKEIATDLKEEFQLEPKLTRKLAKIMNDRSFEDEQAAFENFEAAYEILVEGRND